MPCLFPLSQRPRYSWTAVQPRLLRGKGYLGLPMQETPQSRGREEPLEREMAAHARSLAWRMPRIEEPGGLPSMGSQRAEQDLASKQRCSQLNGLSPVITAMRRKAPETHTSSSSVIRHDRRGRAADLCSAARGDV